MIKNLEEIRELACNIPTKTVAVAVAQDAEVLMAVEAARSMSLAEAILVGDAEQIQTIAEKNGISLESYTVVNESDKAKACLLAAWLVRDGYADFLMKGLVDTSLVLKAVLNKESQLRGSGLMSHVAVFEMPGFDRLLFLSDSAMSIAPSLQDKVSILRNAVAVAHALDYNCPKVAALCAVEKVNPKMPCTEDAAQLAEMNQRGEISGCLVGGPLALDNAISLAAAQHKGISNPVAGQADILLVPDIEAGNLLNKAMEHFAGGKKAGVIMGAKVPIVLVSRASSAEAKAYSIALAAVIASNKESGS